MTGNQKLVSVNPIRAAEAFDKWKQRHRQIENDAAKAFYDQIVSRAFGSKRSGLGLPRSRKTWSDWRTGKIKTTKSLSIEVCSAIHEMTGCDPTEDGLFKDQTRNTTQAIHFRSLALKILSNAPFDGMERYEVSATSIHFRLSETIEVDTEMTGRRGTEKFTLGRAKVGFREARITLQTDGQVVQSLTNLVPSSPPENGSVDGVFLQELPGEQRQWVVQPLDAGYLIGLIANAKLAMIDCRKGANIRISIGAFQDDMDVSFHPNFNNELDPIQQSRARKRIIAKMVHDRLKGGDDFIELSIGEAIA
ncbi:hypothetical protein [Donghicola eburneus]|uniref:hypothetical protein n=1 Tax=Donghicola eburneus TaxID=393278 RepID=UPI0008E2B7CB|nr:hypothetical protein [Donghicola eburneus]SFQ55729.1 hypothetical protein SAMN05421764_1064 [Donghicola eburneus]